MMDIRTYLEKQELVLDGGMGTYYSVRNRSSHVDCEAANLSNPEEIADIHRAYLAAGSFALRTNTYCANRLCFSEAECREIIRAGYEIAVKAAGDAFVFADIGPIDPPDGRSVLEEYRFVVDQFLMLGARHFLFETLGSAIGVHEIAAYIRERCPDAFLLVCYAPQPDGFTPKGQLVSDLLDETTADRNIDAVGLNCICGGRQMLDLVRKLSPLEGLFAVMPCAGYPSVRGSRIFYDGDPSYFASQLSEIRTLGVRILGGCCGTTPEHISAMAEAIHGRIPVRVSYPASASGNPVIERSDPFWAQLCDPKRKPIAVELDPPVNADVSRFMSGAWELRGAGVDMITIADCPVARARMDSSLMACKLHRELGIPALPHMTCRDRNLNATQALLMGLCAEGISNVLLVTGDPLPAASRDEVKTVYNFNSRRLIHYVDSLNRAVLPSPFHIFAALNVNARNFHVQLEMAAAKEENGAVGFLTQPVLTDSALENLQLARDTLHGRLLGGIMPIVSKKNALFMNSEIAGITVDEKIIAAYEGADRVRGEELAVEISVDIARKIAPFIDGFYLMTPFGRTGLVTRIMEGIRAEGLCGEAGER
ncbi:MAG: bifunctional homocysteine S-methyltransferase/methylenetetrahydrofolate reductase [Oscillospiraceae bacterium]|nr:bifunctional homocysteine S-methyltransferase/methylenetetrahydrofolate reductase [Oscillospiraceae bacterium]